MGPARIGVHFAREAAECGLNVGTRETWAEPEDNCGPVQLNPNILTYSFGNGRFSEEGGMPRQQKRAPSALAGF
jgi:hypothetical protein